MKLLVLNLDSVSCFSGVLEVDTNVRTAGLAASSRILGFRRVAGHFSNPVSEKKNREKDSFLKRRLKIF